MKRGVQVFIACTLLSFCAFANPNLQDIVAKAKAEKLWDHPYWHKLLHYNKKNFGGYKSEADALNFFLSPEGKNSPEKEMIADIEQIFDSEKAFDDFNQHPACRFPLRYEWLKNKLSIPVPDHSELPCFDFRSWVERLGATDLSIVFASSYTNNPASMFGHTLLRVHRMQNGQETEPMLNYTVNFAAETGDDAGMLYTIKGLFGAYPGKFSTFPYYQKIQQYNNWESRDLWEYQLNLTNDQLHRVVFHLWEMGSAFFDYFFHDENCSYFLLALLESTDDETKLREHLPFFTIPVDTLKIVGNHTSWIKKEEYRPSLRRKYETRFRSFSRIEKKEFGELMQSKNPDVVKQGTNESKADVLDAMIDYQAMKQKQNTKTDFQKSLLAKRSEIPVESKELNIQKPSNPIKSHSTMRVGLGGSRLRDVNFAHLDFRGAYHDLLDDPAGFDPASQIQSMQGRIRVSTENSDVALEHLKMIEVVSISPIRKYLAKQSWNVGFGWRKNYSNECFDCGAFYLEGGPGFTIGNFGERRLYFTMFANGFLHIGPWNRTNYQVGPSGTSMIVLDAAKHLRFQLSGNVRYSPLGEPDFIYKGTLESALEITPRLSLRGFANQYKESREYGGSLLWYF